MKIRRRIVHYKLSNMLLCICFAMSFICFFNCINLYHIQNEKKKDQVKNQFVNEIELYCSNQSQDCSFASVWDIEKGNAYVQDMLLFRNNVDGYGLVNVILSQNEPFMYSVVEGSIPEDDSRITRPTMILGRGHKEDCTYKGGRWFYRVESTEFYVCAFLGTDSSDLLDYEMFIYYKGVPSHIRDQIDYSESLQVMLGSNTGDVYDTYKKMVESAQNVDSHLLVSAVNESYLNTTYEVKEEIDYYLIIFLFCIVNAVIGSEYWIKRRMREIAIRKIFGYSEWQIFRLLYSAMLKQIVASVVVAMLIQVVLYFRFEEYLMLYVSQIGYYIMVSVLFVIILSWVMLQYPLLILRKDDRLKNTIA